MIEGPTFPMSFLHRIVVHRREFLSPSAIHLSLLLLACFVLQIADAQSQRAGMESIDLSTLDAFEPTDPNWGLAMEAFSDPRQQHSLITIYGTGILVNRPGEQGNANLFTNWVHQDIELEMEIMMPNNSNSGIYLQGRYEIQLLDRDPLTKPSFSDIGGIYERWDETEQRGYEGHPPRVNAGRAPGLWQKLHLIFRAPRFDDNGNKVSDARFEIVTLNGAVIHQNVTVSGPTRAAAFDDEAAFGPLMIQGDHGPVAFRNIRYKLYDDTPAHTSDVSYRVYVGDFTEIPPDTLPTMEGELQSMDEFLVTETQPLLAEFRGQLSVPATGNYHFTVSLPWITGDPHFRDNRIGGATLTIGNEEVLRHYTNATTVGKNINLEQGTHPFSFTFHKSVGWRQPDVNLTIEGPRTPLISLTAPPQSNPPPPPIAAPLDHLLIRGFVLHEDSVRTHAVSGRNSIGHNFSVDLSDGSLLQVWKGPFLDVTAMWHNRGHKQTIQPLGSVLSFLSAPLIEESDQPLMSLGYGLKYESPVFRYSLGDIQIEDHIGVVYDNDYFLNYPRWLRRTLTFKSDNTGAEPIMVQAAKGKSISELPSGLLLVTTSYDSFYIDLGEESNREDHEIKSDESGESLLIPANLSDGLDVIEYYIVW